MATPPRPRLVIGDAIALARLAWIRETQRRLTAMGYAEFRRSDTAILRRLRVGPAAFVELADVVHVSRQAIRKFIEGLDTRGYVSIVRDEGDARRSMVSLTSSGEKYADAVIDVARALHSEVARVVDSADMATAVGVLATVTDKWAAGVS